MSPLVITNDAKEPTIWDRKDSDPEPPLGTDDDEIQRNSRTGADKPQQLQRYWVRTLVLILVPPIITAWYGVIWVQLVLGIETDDAVKYSTFSGSVIYYSWFIIGVFGLSWSQYGLAGVEMAMLQSRFWRAPNLVALLMHSNSTWSSPSGWVKAIYHRQFYLLWCLLTFISILPFIAFPLSGLVFEIGDGHIRTSDHPFVIGKNSTTFGHGAAGANVAGPAWGIGSTPTIPGFGVVYTALGIDRTKHSCLNRVPNTMPQTESITDMFLAPQTEDAPVSGKAWGVHIKYDCSIVRKASEFTILSQKPMSILSSVELSDVGRGHVTLETPSGSFIKIFNSSSGLDSQNTWYYSEIGMNVIAANDHGYAVDPTDDAPFDSSHTKIFEYALWQTHFRNVYEDRGKYILDFNSTLDPVIEGMGGPFFMSENKELVGNDTFFKIRGGQNYTSNDLDVADSHQSRRNGSITDLRDFFPPEDLTRSSDYLSGVAAPIGVRCVSSSDVGTAILDGVASTFKDFERTPINWDTERTVPPFGSEAQRIFRDDLIGNSFHTLYNAANLPGKQKHDNVFRHITYIYPQALLRSVLLAYGMDALNIMYDMAAGFETRWLDTSLTSSRPGKVLGIASLIPGHGTGYFVLVLFCIWSGASVVLGVVYGFRKRPADKLDGYNMLIRGADMAEDLNHDGGVAAGQSFYKNGTVKALPGS